MQINDRKQEIINRMKYEFSQEMGLEAGIAESNEIEKIIKSDENTSSI